MKKFAIAILIIALALTCFVSCSKKSSNSSAKTEEKVEEVGQHYVFRIGASDQAWRAEVVQEAAKRVTEELAAEGCKDTIEVQYEVVSDITKTMALWAKENNFPEFIAQTGGTIADFARSGFVIDAKEVVFDEVHKAQVSENLTNLGYADGKYSGILLDTEVRFVIVNKDALKKLGWSEAQIEAWKTKARAGQITCWDLQALAIEVVNKGICKYGITHRPNKGADWRYTFITWNHGEIPVNEKGQVTISKKNIVEFLSFWRDCVQKGVTPYNHLTDFNWDMLEKDIWPNGESFCWYGQIASKADVVSSGLITGDEFDERYFTIPLPVTTLGDSPVGGSNPYFYALTTAAQKDEKTFEYCRRILDRVLDDDLQLRLSLATTHLGITYSVLETPEYKADKWMSDSAYMNQYMFALPSNQYLSMYGNSQEFFDALQEAEVKALDPSARSVEAIADELISKITFNMGKGNFVLVD